MNIAISKELGRTNDKESRIQIRVSNLDILYYKAARKTRQKHNIWYLAFLNTPWMQLSSLNLACEIKLSSLWASTRNCLPVGSPVTNLRYQAGGVCCRNKAIGFSRWWVFWQAEGALKAKSCQVFYLTHPKSCCNWCRDAQRLCACLS